jgi:hypothetical protein
VCKEPGAGRAKAHARQVSHTESTSHATYAANHQASVQMRIIDAKARYSCQAAAAGNSRGSHHSTWCIMMHAKGEIDYLDPAKIVAEKSGPELSSLVALLLMVTRTSAIKSENITAPDLIYQNGPAFPSLWCGWKGLPPTTTTRLPR